MSDILEITSPFCFLSPAERESLKADLEPHLFSEGATIIRAGDDDDRVYLIESGYVETLRGRIEAGHYFGERAALFGEPRRVDVRAGTPSKVYTMSGERFMRLVHESKIFAQALGDILRDKQGIFAAFDQFMAEIGRAVARNEIPFAKVLPLYTALDPALHPYALDADVIDWGALSYAVRRLPANVTRTFAWFLTDNLPRLYQAPDRCFTAMPTAARPRATYEMLPGKSMVLIRDGLSDLVDFVTCLCVFAIEARKIRRRIGRPELLLLVERGARNEATFEDTIERLPFAREEVLRLTELWQENSLLRLEEMAAHHEDFSIHVQKTRENYNSRHSEVWSAQIARATKELLGSAPSDLAEDVAVHVISSNTHSVSNCLSAFVVSHAEEIMTWAKRSKHRLANETWAEPMDLVYTLTRDWLAANPSILAERRAADHKAGIAKLRETAFTGIEVELVDAARLAKAGPIDASVTSPSGRPALIVNIDFAFGQQAEEIIGTLVSLFGPRIRSVNVLGKAGSLAGKRGDVLVPTRFIEQSNDGLHPLAPLAKLETDRLRRRLGTIGLHVGPMLTVTGTLLQNRMMLNFYKHIWGCIGLEMEGSFYHRKLFESVELGVLREDVTFRYLYYVSDLPLDHTSNLSGRMAPGEGVPPLYAITREILSGIFDSEAARK
jgi:hypothetical protein